MAMTLYHPPTHPQLPAGDITITLSVTEALELRAILMTTYGITSDIEASLSAALTAAFKSRDYMTPYRTKKDDDGDHLVYNIHDLEETDQL